MVVTYWSVLNFLVYWLTFAGVLAGGYAMLRSVTSSAAYNPLNRKRNES